MTVQRLVFAFVLSATVIVMMDLMIQVLAPGGWSAVKILLLACFLLTAPWLGICLGNALAGFAILLCARRPARTVLPVKGDIDGAPITARTALALTVRNEDLRSALPPLIALLDALAPYGDRFALFVLSDTQSPAAIQAEEAAIATAPHIQYRRRAENSAFKAGNVMDFLDHHAAGFDFAITLDADSQMTAQAVLQLVRIMQADPRMGIVQHLTVGLPAASAFPRLFQFGMRAGMRVWATGQAWWQGDCGPYWGHNAILRIAPFRAHARLAPLPDGSPILSHDQVEAAQLRAAGWHVCVWADENGSLEANPPALPEFLRRDERWLAGNLQYRHLLAAPGFNPMGRWQLVQAIMLFLSAPLSTAMLVLATINAAISGASVPRGALWHLVLAWAGVIYAPKLLGYAEILLSAHKRARYGGAARFAMGAASELVFTLLLDAISQPSKTLALARVMLGAKPGWLPQNRADRGVGWGESAWLFWPHALLGIAVFATLLSVSAWATLMALPWAGGLLVAIPFCVWTSAPAVSAWLARRGVAATPEERALPSSPDTMPTAPHGPAHTSRA